MLQFLLANLIFTNYVISPNKTDIWHINHKYDISWDINDTVNVRLELFDNDNSQWVTHFGNNYHFLSTIVDEDTKKLKWEVPTYLTEYWMNSKRIVVSSLTNQLSYYSDNFTIPGITINEIPNINRESHLIEWNTNHKNHPFSLHLFDTSVNYFNLLLTNPIMTINDNLTKQYYNWSDIPYFTGTDNKYRIGVSCDNNLTWGLSNVFEIIRTTTTTTSTLSTLTTSTTSTTSTQTQTSTTSTQTSTTSTQTSTTQTKTSITSITSTTSTQTSTTQTQTTTTKTETTPTITSSSSSSLSSITTDTKTTSTKTETTPTISSTTNTEMFDSYGSTGINNLTNNSDKTNLSDDINITKVVDNNNSKKKNRSVVLFWLFISIVSFSALFLMYLIYNCASPSKEKIKKNQIEPTRFSIFSTNGEETRVTDYNNVMFGKHINRLAQNDLYDKLDRNQNENENQNQNQQRIHVNDIYGKI